MVVLGNDEIAILTLYHNANGTLSTQGVNDTRGSFINESTILSLIS